MNRIVQLACAAPLLLAVAAAGGNAVAQDLPLAAATEEVYSVGAVFGEDWEIFGNIVGVAFAADGNLHVLDAGAYRVVVVDEGGGLVRTVGSRGEGPGEMSDPTSLAILRDGRMVVFDRGAPGHFEVFGPDGEHQGTTSIDFRAGWPGRLLLPLPDGRLVSTGPSIKLHASVRGVADEEAHLRDIDVFSLDGPGKELLHRAWNLPPPPPLGDVERDSERGHEMTIRVPRMRAFEPPLHLAVLSDGRVAVADSVAYRIKLLSLDGTVESVVGRALPPEPVTGAVRAAHRARVAAQLSAPEAAPAPLIDEEAMKQLREQWLSSIESMIFPEEIPVIAGMAVDPEGRVWVERAAPGGDGDGPIDILTPEGEYVGTLAADGPRIPDAFGPGGLMAYIETDEMDIASVRVVRLAWLKREG